MARGIKDKVAILGMGCSQFGERWEAGAEELMVEAFAEAMADAGIDQSQIDAAWFSTHYEEINVGKGGLPLSIALRLPNIAVTRVENFCASGSEAFRGAVYAVASGACDIALALGVEKLKDTGYGGLPGNLGGTLTPQWARERIGAGQLRAARERLPRETPRQSRRSEARHCARVGEEPRKRRRRIRRRTCANRSPKPMR